MFHFKDSITNTMWQNLGSVVTGEPSEKLGEDTCDVNSKRRDLHNDSIDSDSALKHVLALIHQVS